MNQSVIWVLHFDPNMNMSANVSNVIMSANYHFGNIWKIGKFLTTDSAFDFQMHAGMCPSICKWIVIKTSQYKDY